MFFGTGFQLLTHPWEEMRATRVEADHGDSGPARTSRCDRTDSGAARTKCRAARGNTVLSVLTY